jgi:hypothetical protein
MYTPVGFEVLTALKALWVVTSCGGEEYTASIFSPEDDIFLQAHTT